MLKSFTEKFYQGLTGRKPGDLVLSEGTRDNIAYMGKRVRSKDYIYEFISDGSGAMLEQVETTTARWKFLLTGAAIYMPEHMYMVTGAWPRIGLNFESCASLSPFRAEDPNDLNTVLSSLVFGREGQIITLGANHHFEEYKNLYYLLDQRVNIRVTAKPTYALFKYKFYVILTGLEIFEGGNNE